MAEIKSEETSEKKSLNFIEQIVENDLKEGKNGGKVQTRFPPEPNGYLHIGHAKAICLDFGIAAAHGGVCNLRFDDTNPTKEDVEYVEAIKEDIQWLGYKWGNEYYASDYFQQLWDFAIRLIKEGKAYIDEQTSEQIAAQKGTPTQPGVESPYRNRPIEETLDLFQKMNSGEIEEGAMVLRAKIDMASPNMHFRDPIIYRVVKHPHHRTGTTWKAYPMYDFAQYRDILQLDEPVGRKLDFLTQELNRETNTIGSKCQDLDITRIVVDMKAEIEKIREQIQNLE